MPTRGPAEFFFITGADALRAADVLAGCRRIVQTGAFRRLYPAGAPAERRRPARRAGQPHRDPGPGDLLDRVPGAGRRLGEPIWYLVPDGIVQYIAKRKLYHGPGAGAPIGAGS